MLPILYHDDHLLAVHKPAGMLVHTSGLDAGETRFVTHILREQLGCPVYAVHRVGPVHTIFCPANLLKKAPI